MEPRQGAELLRVVRSLAIAFVVAGSTATAQAQSEAEFVAAFSGNWQVFEPAYSEGGAKCGLSLSKTGGDGRYDLAKSNCAAELATVEKWGIVDQQLAFIDKGGLVVVRLGGNQRRMTGTTVAGKPIVFDRIGNDGLASQLEAAVKASGCYYLGFTDKCAPAGELENPLTANPEGDKRIQVVVNLNVRSEARPDAEAIGVVPGNSCVAVETCLTASDGVWCQARFGERNGWLRKSALRQNRWPVVTFVNKCETPSQ